MYPSKLNFTLPLIFCSYKHANNCYRFICNIPIKVNKLRAIIGDQIDRIIGTLPVFPNANDKSLR